MGKGNTKEVQKWASNFNYNHQFHPINNHDWFVYVCPVVAGKLF